MRLLPLVLLLIAGTLAAGVPAQVPACAAVTDKMTPWRTGDLRGANLWQGRWGGTSSPYPGRAIGSPLTGADIDDLRGLGANYVQLSVAGLYGEQPPYALDAGVQTVIDDVVDRSSAAGMFVVIAFRSGPGRNEQAIARSTNTAVYGPILEDVWTSPAAQTAWLDMLRYTATRYGPNPAVIGIDPMVEPNDVARRGFLAPQDFLARYGGTPEDVNVFNVRSVTAVRAVSDVPVLVEGDGYGSVGFLPTVTPTGDPRSVYTVHYYEPGTFTNQAPGAGLPEPGVAAQRQALAPLATFASAYAVPVAVTEFGVHRYAPGAATYLSDTLAVLDGMGAAHAEWEFVVAAQRPLFNDFDIEGGTDPAVQAKVGGPLEAVVRTDFARNCARPGVPPAPAPTAAHWILPAAGVVAGVGVLAAVLRLLRAWPLRRSR